MGTMVAITPTSESSIRVRYVSAASSVARVRANALRISDTTRAAGHHAAAPHAQSRAAADPPASGARAPAGPRIRPRVRASREAPLQRPRPAAPRCPESPSLAHPHPLAEEALRRKPPLAP